MGIHWTAPVGAFVFTGCSFVPGAWLGFVLLILVHEVGHAVMARTFRCAVISVRVHGLGGECQWAGTPTPRQRALIAWGGVFGQMVVLVAAVATTPLFRHMDALQTPFFAQLISALVATNLLLMALNLLPIRPLDGAEAWKLFSFRNPLPGFRRRRAQAARKKSLEKELARLERLDRAFDERFAKRSRDVRDLLN